MTDEELISLNEFLASLGDTKIISFTKDREVITLCYEMFNNSNSDNLAVEILKSVLELFELDIYKRVDIVDFDVRKLDDANGYRINISYIHK